MNFDDVEQFLQRNKLEALKTSPEDDFEYTANYIVSLYGLAEDAIKESFDDWSDDNLRNLIKYLIKDGHHLKGARLTILDEAAKVLERKICYRTITKNAIASGEEYYFPFAKKVKPTEKEKTYSKASELSRDELIALVVENGIIK